MLGQCTYGMFQTVFIAFCDGEADPEAAVQGADDPDDQRRRVALERMHLGAQLVPMTGKFPSAESISCSRSAGLPDSAKPRMVASSSSSGNSANRP